MKPMMLLGAVALLLQQEAPEVREKIERMTRPRDCGLDIGELREFVKLAGPALEILPELIQTGDKSALESRLAWYAFLVELKEPARTPTVILNLARSGADNHNVKAAEIALQILDDRARAFLIEGLKRIAASEGTESGSLESVLIDRAGRSHSEEAGKILLDILGHPNAWRKIQVIDALGNLGYAPALDALKKLGGEKYPIPGRARGAIEKIELLASPDRAVKLLEKVRIRLGEIPPCEWALDQIVHLGLATTVDDLRKEYDDLVKTERLPQDGNQWTAVLLHSIQKLGGHLSPEETALLKDLGRLPLVKRVKADDLEVKKGFADGVWAPLEERRKAAEAKNARPPRLTEDQLPRFMKERINFVMDLNPPDPSYLAPDAVLALETIEEMLSRQVNEADCDKLLRAYLHLAQLREGMKTPVVIYRLASVQQYAAAIVTTIADDKAEAWYLEALKGRRPLAALMNPGRLSSEPVKAALLKWFREGSGLSERMAALRALADLGCVELLPELETLKENPSEIREAKWRLEIFAAPDRDQRLLAMIKRNMVSGSFSSGRWGLDQIVRLNLKHLAPELRAWYDGAEKKWVPWTDMRGRVLQALVKFGAPISAAEEEILKKSGRSTPPAR